MAERKPVVLVGGVLKEMPSGDALPAANIPEVTAPNIHAAPSKATPADADELGLSDSAASWGLKKLTFANLKAWIGSLFVSKSGDTINGNLNFSGAGRRITGDFSNATIANRTLFQASALNTASVLGVIPNGTDRSAAVDAVGNSDPDNAPYTRLLCYGVAGIAGIAADKTGSGAYLPMIFQTGGTERLRIDTSGNVGVGTTPTAQLDQYSLGGTAYNGAATDGQLAAGATHLIRAAAGNNTNVAQVVFQSRAGQPYNRIVSSGGTAPFMAFVTNNAERMRVDSSGNVLVTGGGGLGYGVGSGGTVTQATSKSTTVTLNKHSGRITMNNAALAAGAAVQFQVNNNLVADADAVVLNIFAGTANASSYRVIGYVQGSAFFVRLTNESGGSLSDAVLINFAIIKGVTS